MGGFVRKLMPAPKITTPLPLADDEEFKDKASGKEKPNEKFEEKFNKLRTQKSGRNLNILTSYEGLTSAPILGRKLLLGQ